MTLTVALMLPLAFGFASWAMAGAATALISVPIIIHILNRRRFKVVTWAAMEFLNRAMRKNRRRLEFEQWLLLATRCLLVFLLGLALARPMGCDSNSLAGHLTGRTGLNVIVIDNSYSMAYQADRPNAKTHLDQAKIIAQALINQMSPGGESVTLITTGSPVKASGPDKSLSKIGYDLNQAKDAVGLIPQTYAATDLVGALRLALQVGREESREPNKNLIILSDATRSAWEPQANALKQLGPELARMFKVTHYNLSEGRNQTNDAVLDVSPVGGLVRVKFDSDFRADVRAYGPGVDSTVQWTVDDQPLGTPIPVHLGPDVGEILTKDRRPVFPTGGPHVITVSVSGAGDHLPADNTRIHVEDIAADLRVLLVEGKRGAGVAESSGSTLAAALTPAHDEKIKTLSSFLTEPISDLELGNRALQDYSAVVLTDVAQITPPEADRLKQFVEQGGTLLVFMGESVDRNNYNTVLYPRKLMPGQLVKLISAGVNQQPFRLNFKPNEVQNEYLESFRGVENSGLSLVAVRTYWQLDIPQNSSVTPILRYVSAAADAAADPVMTAHALGQGRVLWVSTSANGAWTDFPAHRAYTALMQELLAHSVKSGTFWMNLEVGEPLSIPSSVRMTAAPTLLDPDKKPLPLESKIDETADRVGGAATYTSTPLKRPGLYSLSLGETTIPIAVNIPAAESDVRTINDQAIREALGRIDLTLQGDQAPSDGQVAEAGRDWGWHLMLAVLVLLGLEAFMAMRFGHWRQQATVSQ